MTDFGTDLSCTDSIVLGRLVSGPRLVAEACYRRLITPRGMLRGGEAEADYGLDLTSLIGDVATTSDAAALSSRIKAELLKDDRLESVDVDVQVSGVGATKAYAITINGETAAGPFDLTIAASNVSVDLLGITLS